MKETKPKPRFKHMYGAILMTLIQLYNTFSKKKINYIIIGDAQLAITNISQCTNYLQDSYHY